MSRNAEMIMPDGMTDNEAGVKLSELRALCEELRNNFYPPQLNANMVLADLDLPIWIGKREDVKRYHLKFKKAFDLAHKFYPQAKLFKFSTLPAKLKLPQFHYDVTRLSISKNVAKESLSFSSVGALVNKCSEFELPDMQHMTEFFNSNPKEMLVCHREFIDFRARMHFFNTRQNKPEKETLITQFYTTGLVIAAHDVNDFEVIDHRNQRIRQYRNAYRDPIASNGTWKVYVKKT